MVQHLQAHFLGAKVVNIYDAPSSSQNTNDTLAIKLDVDNSKQFLMIQSGIRFHSMAAESLDFAGTTPSPFCAKLRKHLRNARLAQVTQLGGPHERVVLLGFLGNSSTTSLALVVELYSKGNILLLDAAQQYTILALWRSHVYDKRQNQNDNNDNNTNDEEKFQVRVGKIYPVTYATQATATTTTGDQQQQQQQSSSTGDDDSPAPTSPPDKAVESTTGILSADYLAWIAQQMTTPKQQQQSKKKKDQLTLKSLLLKPSSGVFQYGPAILEHCTCLANLSPHQPLLLPEHLQSIDWSRLRTVLQTEPARILQEITTQPNLPGYLYYKPQESNDNDDTNDTATDTDASSSTPPSPLSSLPHPNKILVEFQPLLLQKHNPLPHIQVSSFNTAVADFFQQLAAQKHAQKAHNAQQAALHKLQKVHDDQAHRLAQLHEHIEDQLARAQVVELYATQVDAAIQVVQSALHAGMDWDQLHEIVRVEQEERHNPIALLIHELQLQDNVMVLALPKEDDGEHDDDTTANTIQVSIDLTDTAHGNASRLFAQYRAAKEKSRKTMEASSQALKAAQATAERQLAAAQEQQQQPLATASFVHKKLWFEKFHWMITSDNYLVLAGKDAHQNETLVKRYLRKGDAYLHADVHGAASVIVRAKRLGPQKGALPISEQALREAGQFTICHSSAWASRVVTSAWWVHQHQVSKTAPSGEYLTTGSFMIRGKKNFLPPVNLEMGLAVLFRLGDAESIARHKNQERRDFMLMSLLEEEDMKEDSKAIGEKKIGGGSNPGKEDGDDEDDQEQPASTSDDVTSKATSDNVESNPAEEVENEADEANSINPEDQDNSNNPPTAPPKRKGLSARDRRLIKKYGSLEKAEQAQAGRNEMMEKAETVSNASSLTNQSPNDDGGDASTSVASVAPTKRGKKSKLKRQKKKYADQDDEDRELALLLLQGSGKKGGHRGNKKRQAAAAAASKTQTDLEVGAATAAVLVKDSAEVASNLPDSVRDTLAECLRDDSNEVVQWENMDPSVLEQLVLLQPEEAQLAAVNRLLSLKEGMKADNVTSSLAGILRTVRKYGHENLNKDETAEEQEIEAESASPVDKSGDDLEWNEVDDDGQEVDDTTELDKLTAKPHPEDVLIQAVPVCAPYSTLSHYQYRVKLTPGNGKRGKASKQCVDMMLKSIPQTPKSNGNHLALQRELIKRINDNDWVQAMISNVKITAPGSSKLIKQQKGKGKKGKR